MLKRETILELGLILREEFGYELNRKDLEKIAYCLVGYFDLLAKIEYRYKFGNSPDRRIDSNRKSDLDKNGGAN